MEFLWRILNLWRKELLVILKDPANRIVLVAPVLMQSVLFGYAVTSTSTTPPTPSSTSATANPPPASPRAWTAAASSTGWRP